MAPLVHPWRSLFTYMRNEAAVYHTLRDGMVYLKDWGYFFISRSLWFWVYIYRLVWWVFDSDIDAKCTNNANPRQA